MAAGCRDTAASFLACGASREGVCVDVAGTASVFAATTSQFRADVEHGMLGLGPIGRSGTLVPLCLYQWRRDERRVVRTRSLAARPASKKTLGQLDRLASRMTPAAADPLFVPHLGGRVTPSQPLLRGCWAGLTWSHTAAHLYRAVLEGVALEYCLYRDVLQTLDPEWPSARSASPAAANRSALWNQIKADALETQRRAGHAARRGAAGGGFLAGFGVGLFRDLDATARRWIKTENAVRPNRSLAPHYRARLTGYRRLLDVMGQWSNPETGGHP